MDNGQLTMEEKLSVVHCPLSLVTCLFFRDLIFFEKISPFFWKRNLNKLLYKVTEAKGGQVAVASKFGISNVCPRFVYNLFSMNLESRVEREHGFLILA
jgi:hypothetical protein